MKILLLFISVFPLIVIAQGFDLEPKNNRIIFEPLVNNTTIKNGGIKKEHIYTLRTRINGKIDSTLTDEIIYDSLGFVVSKKEFLAKTTLQKNYHYSFNSNGQISLLRIETKTPKLKTHFTEIRYNNFGDEVSKYDYDENHKNKIILLKVYNEIKQCVFLKYLNNDNKYYTAKAFHYDANGNLAKTEIFIGINVEGPEKTYLYNTQNGRESVSILNKNNETEPEVASFAYNLEGQCTEAVVQQKKYKTSSPSSVNDYNVTLSNDRNQGVNNMPETYTVSGSGISNINVGNTLVQRAGASESAITGNNITIEQAKQETGGYHITSGYTGKNFFYNLDGTLALEVYSPDNNQIIISKKHYYYQ